MDAGQVAALIAAVFFAAGMCAMIYVLARLSRLISAATALVNGYRDGAGEVLRRASAAVDLADEQLTRTGALAESVEQVSASMTELSDQVTAIASTARLISGGLGGPVIRLAAAGYGVRRAVALRRPGRNAASGGRPARDRAIGARDRAAR